MDSDHPEDVYKRQGVYYYYIEKGFPPYFDELANFAKYNQMIADGKLTKDVYKRQGYTVWYIVKSKERTVWKRHICIVILTVIAAFVMTGAQGDVISMRYCQCLLFRCV